MDIIQRNFLRLLKSGAFGLREQIEPMSAWKWNRLYQLSQMHEVCPWCFDGMKNCADDFFLKIRPEQMQLWQQTVQEMDEEIPREEEQHLTNPLLNRKLQHAERFVLLHTYGGLRLYRMTEQGCKESGNMIV